MYFEATEVVPSDDLDHVLCVFGEDRFALAASIDLAIAASIGLMCSDAFVLLFISVTPFVSPSVGLSVQEDGDFCAF